MKRQGFTLIELLVVILIMSILLSLLMPCLQAARGLARGVICADRLGDWGFVLEQYTSDHSGAFPNAIDERHKYIFLTPPGGLVGSGSYDIQTGWWWFHFLKPYIGSGTIQETEALLRCPARNIENISMIENPLLGNYGVNMSIMRKLYGASMIPSDCTGEALKVTDIQRPPDTLMMLDAGYAMISWKGASDLLPMEPLHSRCHNAYVPGLFINQERQWRSEKWPREDCHNDAVKGRHNNRTVNVLFADYHVDTPGADELYVSEEDIAEKRLGFWQP